MICKTCKQDQPESEFWKGSQSRCRSCESRRRVKYQRRINLKHKYGITETDYDRMLVKQNGVCGLCGGVNSVHPLCVDHDHKTGRVRGLLCHACNRGIGLLGDDPERLRKAIVWMETH